ncbi:MAG TPA: MFS transporter [Candidatus Binatia bacterium]
MTARSESQQEWKQLVVICLGAFLFFNSFGSINVALPNIQAEFDSSLAAIQWVSMMGLVMLSSLSFCFARAGNLLGQRTLYRGGVLLYAMGAGLAALSTSFTQLLIFRAVMSVGLAMAVPMSAAILAAVYPAHRRGYALGLLASAVAIGRTTGPTIGGFLVYLWGWRAIFLLNLAIGMLVSAAVFSVFKGREERKRGAFDLWGSAALMIGYPALLIALSLGANSGWGSAQTVFWLSLAASGLSFFFYIERRVEKPLVDVALLKSRPLAAALLSLAIGTAAYSPINVAAPLFMQQALALSPLAIGFVMAALPLCTALASPLSGRLADRIEAKRISALGLGFILAGIFVYAAAGFSSTVWSVALALMLIGIGTGFFIPANQKAAFATVGSEDYGILSAMLSSFGTAASTLGTTLTVALIETRMFGGGTDTSANFAAAQSFAFAALVPLAAIALAVTLIERKGSTQSTVRAQNDRNGAGDHA